MSGESKAKQGNKRKKRPPPSISGENEEVASLDWRMDPKESYSDWKIEISVGGTFHGSYHVHRAILAVGSKRSEYFVRLFANECMKEHETHTSCIEMEELAAQAFPVMLDYMYSRWDNDEKPFMVENVVALHYFGRYFEVRGLQEEAQAFWKNTMTVDQAGTYLEHATLFHDDHVHDAVAEKCASSGCSIEVSSRLMELSDVKFWLAVLGANKNEPNLALSTMVSSFCSTHQDLLDSDSFLQLTDKSVLPKLSVAAAVELLQLEQVFMPTSAMATKLSSLQERGMEALTSCSKPDLSSLMELQRGFKDFPPLILVQMLQQSIGKLWDSNKTKSCTRKEIVVSGAGTDAVNGIYSRVTQLHDRAPRYIMDGNWNDSPTRFELYKYKASDGWYWYISILHGTEPGGRDKDFYYVFNGSEGNCLPPRTGWRDYTHGLSPVPTVSSK